MGFLVGYCFLASNGPLAKELNCMPSLDRWDLKKNSGSLKILQRYIKIDHALNLFIPCSTGNNTSTPSQQRTHFLIEGIKNSNPVRVVPSGVLEGEICPHLRKDKVSRNCMVILLGHLKPFSHSWGIPLSLVPGLFQRSTCTLGVDGVVSIACMPLIFCCCYSMTSTILILHILPQKLASSWSSSVCCQLYCCPCDLDYQYWELECSEWFFFYCN